VTPAGDATADDVADDEVLDADAAVEAGVATDCKVPLPLTAGPQATRANDNAPAASAAPVLLHRVPNIGGPPSSGRLPVLTGPSIWTHHAPVSSTRGQ
jgi:hypothetical protein